MKYSTVKGADKKIQHDLDIIIKEINNKIKDVVSIYLIGGFSRGEGPIKKIKGKFYPYNDYDIQIVVRKKINKESVDEISTEISKKLGYRGIELFYKFRKEEQNMKNNFYVDLKADTLQELKKLLPRIRTYELKNNPLLLYGKDAREFIPGYDLNEIPLADSAKLLLDRMSQMIEYYSTRGEEFYDKEFLTYIIQQVYSACCTSLLILTGKFEIGYLKRAEKFNKIYKNEFPELYKKLPELNKKILKFTKWKSNPKKLPNQNVEEEWFIAKDHILEVSKYFFSKFLNKKIETAEELSKSILEMNEEFYMGYMKEILKQKTGISSNFLAKIALFVLPGVLGYKYYLRLKKLGIDFKITSLKYSPDRLIFGSLVYIIGSISQKRINEGKLRAGQRILKRVYPSRGKNWEEISLDYANAYIAFFLQKL